jgi:hypothetical protein
MLPSLPSLNTTKFGFRIRTRHGLVVEHLMIHGRDEADAERKLRQMYLHCEILERSVMKPAMLQPTLEPAAKSEGSGVSFEEIASLISK